MDCEMFLLNDGSYQCGNCGMVYATVAPGRCLKCGADVIDIIDEGEADDSTWLSHDEYLLDYCFPASIQWRDTGEKEDVIMATYDTEGTPEDEYVFFSFGGYTKRGLAEELSNWNSGKGTCEDFSIVSFDLDTAV